MLQKIFPTLIICLLSLSACNSSKSSDQSDTQAINPVKKVSSDGDSSTSTGTQLPGQKVTTECRSQSENILLRYVSNASTVGHVSIFRGAENESTSNLFLEDDVSLDYGANFYTLNANSAGQFKVMISRPLDNSSAFLGTLKFLNSLDIEIGLECKILNDTVIPTDGQGADADLIDCWNPAQTQSIRITKLPDMEVVCSDGMDCPFAHIQQRRIEISSRRPPGDDDTVISNAIATDIARATYFEKTIALDGQSLSAVLSRTVKSDGTFDGTYSIGNQSSSMTCSAVYLVMEQSVSAASASAQSVDAGNK